MPVPTQEEEKLANDKKKFMSEAVIEDNAEDDKLPGGPAYEKADPNHEFRIKDTLEEDNKDKEKFLRSEEYHNFSSVLVIAQIRMDCTNDDPFLKHLFNVEKAIRKATREILLKLGKIQSKAEFKEVQESLLKVFYGDINIGFITSTGQIKSTSFIYMNKTLIDILNRQKLNLQFNKIALKITLTFFAVNSLRIIPPTATSTQMDVKQNFLRNNKFYNEFLVLSQTIQEELKDGISIFFVYRAIDDQIYAVKRVLYFYHYESRLHARKLSFFDVFQSTSLNEMTIDQRKIREAKILSKLTHPNVLRLYDWWIEQANGFYYLYMQLEYCSFPGFKHQTTDLLTFSYFYLNPLPDQQKLLQIRNIMNQILDGLGYIHNRGVIHRDLKPENLFVTISITGELQVMLADFDQGKDVREEKLSTISEERLKEEDLNSVKSQNTIKAGTSGYQTDNYNRHRQYDQSDEFYAIGVTLLHLILTFPGEPKNRNHYTKTFTLSDSQDVIPLIDNWAAKYVKNRHKDFSFNNYKSVLQLAKKLLSKYTMSHEEIRNHIQTFGIQ